MTVLSSAAGCYRMKRLRSSSSSDSSDNESESSVEKDPITLNWTVSIALRLFYSHHLSSFRSLYLLLLLQQEWQ